MGGGLLILLHTWLLLISHGFVFERPAPTGLILWMVAAEVLAGIVYLRVLVGRGGPASSATPLLVVTGLLLRVVTLPSTPVLEDDVYRYLWDGAVLCHGVNPYRYAPAEADRGAEQDDATRRALGELAVASGHVFPRINHPRVRTIYPPVAQATFALSCLVRPWSILAWRLVLLGFDVTALVLLHMILKELNLPRWWMAVYWWNPLLIHEVYNTNHVDMVALPLVLAALLTSIRGRPVFACGVLGLAVGVKLWPVLLFPYFLRPVFLHPRRLLAAAGVFGLVVGAQFFPVYAGGFGADSGFVAYARMWEMNDAFYMLFLWAVRFILKLTGGDPGLAQILTRALVAALVGAWVLWNARKKFHGPLDICERCTLAVALLFLLSPTQFPWYYLWLLPFLAIRPRLSLLLLTALLPLYYLRFAFLAADKVSWFDNGVVWLEYLPVLWLLFLERGGRRPFPTGQDGE